MADSSSILGSQPLHTRWQPDTTMTDYRDSLDHITDHDMDQNVPTSIASPDWVAELRERWSR